MVLPMWCLLSLVTPWALKEEAMLCPAWAQANPWLWGCVSSELPSQGHLKEKCPELPCAILASVEGLEAERG